LIRTRTAASGAYLAGRRPGARCARSADRSRRLPFALGASAVVLPPAPEQATNNNEALPLLS